MRNALLAILTAFLVGAPALAAERAFPVGSFDAIVVSASSDVEVRTGQAPSVLAIGDPQDLERLDIRVDGDRLVIEPKKGKRRGMSRKPLHIRVTTGSLASAAIRGSGDMAIDTINGPFSGRISGSGDMRVGSLQSPVLSLAISGSGNILASGSCGEARYSISGSGSIRAGTVACETARASISGSGNIDLSAAQASELRLAGSGTIKADGGGRCTIGTTGSGTIRCG